MAHAEHDLLHAELAAALDDLFQRRNRRLAAVETEALGPEEAHAREFLETLGFDKLVQDRALALGREGNLLVGSFDAALEPVFLLGIVDVHEFVADAPAIGALQDFDHAARGCAFQTQHAADKHRPVEIFGMKSVKRRFELRVGRLGREMERVEIGFEMADDAIGAYHLNRADGIQRRRTQIALARLPASPRRPVAGEGADKIAACEIGLGVAPPLRAAAKLGRVQVLFAQARKIGSPGRIHGVRIFLILSVE